MTSRSCLTNSGIVFYLCHHDLGHEHHHLKAYANHGGPSVAASNAICSKHRQAKTTNDGGVSMSADNSDDTLPFDLTMDRRAASDTDEMPSTVELAKLLEDPNTTFHDLTERYTLIKELAAGASGTVWLAEDRLLNRDVAIRS